MKRSLLIFLVLRICTPVLQAQFDCIQVDPLVCLSECVPVTYIGTITPGATYTWSSTCGTFTNPAQQDPGMHCFSITGICILQVIIQVSGMAPDTCAVDVLVNPFPDGVIEGDTTICSGTCAPLVTTFLSGAPPFTYQIDDGEFVNFYNSTDPVDSIPVCPSFSTTYTLVSITDGNGCSSPGPFNAVDVNVTPGINATITQTGNVLCANPPGQNYQWYDCGFSTLQSITACFDLTQDGCYCVIVSDDQTGLCVDTACGNFLLTCDLDCEIIAADSICTGDSVLISYSGNASSSATFEWLIDLPGAPGTAFSGVDSIALAYNVPGCYHIQVTVTDGVCTSTCSDSICVFDPFSVVSFGSDTSTCDTCIAIPIFFTGIAPWAVTVFDGTNVETIAGIFDSVYFYTVCPPEDSVVYYSLLGATDGIGLCPVTITDDSVAVVRHSLPVALVIQNGNEICAAPVAGTYEWWDCGLTQLISFDSCVTLIDTTCFCLIVSNGFCTDTLCGEYIFTECQLTCDIVVPDVACIGDTVIFAYTGNASSGAIFNWLIDVPGFPQMPVTGNDTVVMVYDQPGCYHASVAVFDLGCFVTCSDSICISGPSSEISICCDIEACGACTDLMFTLNGAGPWTLVLTDGTTNDTLTGITSSPYIHTVCPPADSVVTYTILFASDSVDICPVVIVGDSSATVLLHPYPTASIFQNTNTLCAFPSGMAGYGWYSCPAGAYLDTGQCFVPLVSGCYCVDVSTADDCVDTACVQFIISSTKDPGKPVIAVSPNPSHEDFTVTLLSPQALPVPWGLYDALGQRVEHGSFEKTSNILEWPVSLPAGVYILRVMTSPRQLYSARLIRI